MCNGLVILSELIISNTVNIDKYSSHKQTLFGVLNNFKDCKGGLKPNSLRTAGLKYSIFCSSNIALKNF